MPKLEYVKEGDRIEHVSKYAHLLPGERPAVVCPECGAGVWLKLGPKVRHHAAHKPDSLCILTQPETVLHLNTKIYLHKQLLQVKELYIDQFCAGWTAPAVEHVRGGPQKCWGKKKRPYLWLSSWDRVEMEKRIESRKPDIVFYREGVPVAAIEVFATHAVDELKKADLARLGVPWVEVKADEEIYRGEYAWQPAMPLPYVAIAPPPPEWTCEQCKTEPARYVERTQKGLHAERLRYAEEAQRSLEEKRRRTEQRLREEVGKRAMALVEDSRLHPRHTTLARVAFVYGYNGKRAKFEYFLTRENLGTRERITLLFGRMGTVLFTRAGQYDEGIREAIGDAYRTHFNEHTREPSIFKVFEVTGWVPYSEVSEALAKWQSPYLWNKEKNTWEKVQ